MSFAIGFLTEGGDRSPSSGATAFAIAPDLALTAFHCVGDRVSGRILRPELKIVFRNGWVRATPTEMVDPALDLAVLRLQHALPAGEIPVPLSSEPRRVGFFARGYPRVAGEMSMSGQIVDADARLFGPGAPAVQLFCEQASAGMALPLGGFSGAPVLVDDPPLAVAVVRWNPPGPTDSDLAYGATVYATPISTIAARWGLTMWGQPSSTRRGSTARPASTPGCGCGLTNSGHFPARARFTRGFSARR